MESRKEGLGIELWTSLSAWFGKANGLGNG